MRKNNVILFLLTMIFLCGCDKMQLVRDNPLDGQNNENQIKGICLMFDNYDVASDSNGDGIVNSGENIGLGIKLKNTGSSSAIGVYATFSCSSSYVLNYSPSNTIRYDDISSGNSKYNYSYYGSISPTLTLKISSSTPKGTKIPINVNITDAQGNSWKDSFEVVVY